MIVIFILFIAYILNFDFLNQKRLQFEIFSRHTSKITIGITGCEKYITRALFIWDWWGKAFKRSRYYGGIYYLCSLNSIFIPKDTRKSITEKLIHLPFERWIAIDKGFENYLNTISQSQIPRYKVEHLLRPFSYYKTIMKTRFLWSLRVDDGAFVHVQNLYYLLSSLRRFQNPLYNFILQGCCFSAYPTYLDHKEKSVQIDYPRYVIQGGSGQLTSRYFVKSYLAIAEEVLRLQDCDDDWQIADWGIKFGISPMNLGSPFFFAQTKDFWALPISLYQKKQFEVCKGDLVPTMQTCGVNKIVPLSIKVVFHEQDIYVKEMVELMKLDYSDIALYHDYFLSYSFCNWTAYILNHSNLSWISFVHY